MSRRIVPLLVSALALSACSSDQSVQLPVTIDPPVSTLPSSGAPQPVASPAIEAIVDALRGHAVVAIGETHGSADLRAFLVELSRDRSFREATHTIAVEVSTSAQETIDAYLAGSVDDRTLLAALRDGIFSETGAADIRILELYQAVRDVNRNSDASHQLRVLAVDAPLSWATVDAAADLAAIDRERAMASTLTGVLNRGEHALWVVGASHLTTTETPPPPGPSSAPGLLPSANARGLLEQSHPGSVSAIALYSGFGPQTAELEPRLPVSVVPGVLSISGTWVAGLPSSAQGSPNAPGQVLVPVAGADSGGSIPALPSGPPPPRQGLPASMPLPAVPARIGDSFDGLLYLGKCNELRADIPPRTVFEDATYRAELDRRFNATQHHPFAPDEYYSVMSSLFGQC